MRRGPLRYQFSSPEAAIAYMEERVHELAESKQKYGVSTLWLQQADRLADYCHDIQERMNLRSYGRRIEAVNAYEVGNAPDATIRAVV